MSSLVTPRDDVLPQIKGKATLHVDPKLNEIL